MATRQTFSTQFYCRKSKADKKGLAPVELSIVINGERTYLRLPRKARPEEFKKDLDNKRHNPTKVYCENQRNHLYDIIEEMQFANIEITAENVKAYYKMGGVAKFYTLGQLWQDIIANKDSERATGDIQLDAYQRYNRAMEAFYKATGYTKDTPAKNVDIQDITRLRHYLRDKGLKQSTIYQYDAKCKAAFTLAFNRGKIKANPYAQVKMCKGEKKDIVWLTTDELKILNDKDFATDRLRSVRDLFLFQCYSGLAYKDMSLLVPSDYERNEQGMIFIEKSRSKTGVGFVSYILDEGKRILERYDYVLPMLSNQKYNAYLKEIQDLCGLKKHLTTHVGRKTYICYLYQKHVDIEVIAALVGHRTCHTTLKYYAKMDKTAITKELRKRHVAQTLDKTKTKERVSSSPDAQAAAARRKKEQQSAILDTLRTSGIELTK